VDLTTAFRAEVFRPVMTLLVPGATALAPYALVVRQQNPNISGFFERHPLLATAILLVAVLALGFVLEDIGSRIETFWDRRLQRKNNSHIDEWYRYLMLAFTSEPIGQRYLRTLTLRLKFELHFGVALLVMLPGYWWLDTIVHLWTLAGFRWFAGATLVLAVYLLLESATTVGLLAGLRHELLLRYYPTPGINPTG